MAHSIRREDILSPENFSRLRGSELPKIIRLKNLRRVMTKTFSFLFECRETVLNQVNEMVLIENVHDEREISRLMDVYSELLPEDDTLSVSMFIEISDEKVLARELPRLAGIENTVYITFDGSEVHADPEEGRSTEVLESTLQYLRFRFNTEAIKKFRDAKYVYIETRKEGYRESARIDGELLASLQSELKSP